MLECLVPRQVILSLDSFKILQVDSSTAREGFVHLYAQQSCWFFSSIVVQLWRRFRRISNGDDESMIGVCLLLGHRLNSHYSPAEAFQI